MSARILVLGAGFAGLELTTTLSEELGENADITLIEKSDSFVFGFSKLDVMFGHAASAAVRLPYRDFVKSGVRFRQETVTTIDPNARRVTTDRGTYDADVLVIALGADYDVSTTPGVVLGENEFYSVAGAERLRELLPTFVQGRVVIGICGAPYKCPPAPSECALMLHDYLSERGVRSNCTITLTTPLPSPVPPSPDTSRALVEAFTERGIELITNVRVVSVDAGRRVALLDDGRELGCDLFLGIPKQRAPDVVVATGMTEDGWVSVDPRTLTTRFPDVYAVGDLANTGAPKAGVFAEAAARAVARNVIAKLQGQQESAKNPGAGSCYIEFGAGRIARVDVDFFSGPKPTGSFQAPSPALRAEKQQFGASRRARWFGS
jgi:sulfide:quinone oxidoreductase